jgi:hypothetical protein
MPFDAPFSLGPFLVDHAGRLVPDIGTAPSVWIAWRGRSVHVGMSQRDDALGTLHLSMVVARVPSTATPRAAAREQAFATLRRVPAELPEGWRISLQADHRVVLEAKASLPLPASARTLVTELTVFLLAVDPYLTLLDEAGFAAASAAGMAKTCPG